MTIGDSYHHRNRRRALRREIEAYIAKRTASTVVHGLDQIVDLGGAVANADRVAGFMESYDRRDWYLPLGADAGLAWETHPVPAAAEEKVSFLLSIGFGNGSPLPTASAVNATFRSDLLVVLIVRCVTGEK